MSVVASAGGRGENSSPRVHPPKQDRSRRTLERIAEAALDLMEEGGVENATVAAIVDRADASVGSFYARFSGKDDLILFLKQRVWSDAKDRWDEALDGREWSTRSLQEVVEGVITLLLRVFREDYRRRRVLGQAGHEERDGPRRVLEFHQHILSTLTPLLRSHQAEIGHPDPEWAVRLGYRFTVGAIREILEVEYVGGVVDGAASAESLVPELTRYWTAYLGSLPEAWPRPEEGPRPVDFFDPWG